MIDTVECPYCEHDNDLSDGTVDLPNDLKFDHECEDCEREFEVEVEFEPCYSANKIVYEVCEKCGTKTRDILAEGFVFPYPEHVDEEKLCKSCFLKAMDKQYEMEAD